MGFFLRVNAKSAIGLVATCDYCGEVVTANDANLLWSPNNQFNLGSLHRYRIAHKSGCTQHFDKELGKQHWQGLDAALIYLLNNTHCDVEAAKRRISFARDMKRNEP